MDEGILNELLECSVCLERLDSSSKVLPCQHTFCKRCLEEIFTSRKELRCPECRILVETKINDLPNNFLLIRLLEGIKYAPRAANKLENGNDSILLTSSHERPSNPETSSPSNNKPSLSIEPDKSVDKVTSKKQTVQPHPCAKALYTYEAKEPGDLSFKKGDIIMLKKKIDQNWYHGEHGSKHGFFPINYVQVITPLPSQLPQAKALFDFSYHESDEKDCLSFKKGDILTVIRRVDENWVEGKLKEKIGIFPISFVEMNGVAKAVVKLSSNITAGPIREVPPAPQKQNVVLSPTSSHTIATSTQSESCSINPPKLNTSISSDQQFAQKSSKNETPRKTSCSQNVTNQSSAEAGITSTIPQPLPQPPCHPKVNFHRRDKRHSVSVSSITTPVSSKNVTRSSEHGYRHSIDVSHMAPITIPSHIARPRGATHPIVESSQSNSTVTSSSSIPTSTNTTLTDTSGCQLVRRHSSNRRERNNTVNHSRQHSAPDPSSLAASSHAVHSQVPAFYVAMYSYKPQKEDELELKKNELYTVSEKCLDGWFKGTSLRTAQTGVFPGNYVQVAKPSILQANFQQIMSSNVALKVSSNGSMNAQNSNKPSSKEKHHGNANQRTNASGHDANSRSGSNHSRSKNSVASPPPRPPRPQASMEGSASPWVAKSNSSVNSLQSQKMTVALPPYGNNVSKASINSTMVSSNPTVVNSLPQGQTVCSTTSSQSWHGVIPSTSRPQAASLLTSASTITPPNVSVNSSPSNIAQAKVVKEKKEGMSTVFKRLTGVKKKSKSPPPNNISMDNPNFIDSSKPVTPIHIRSGSCPSENLASTSQKKSNETDKNVTPQRPKQPAPLIRERFRCIVPYPPNCDYELELKVGDIIYVHKKRDDGWYKGTLQRTGITGLFPGSFVEKF